MNNSKSDKNYQKMQDSTHNITHCGKISILTPKIPIHISKVNVKSPKKIILVLNKNSNFSTVCNEDE